MTIKIKTSRSSTLKRRTPGMAVKPSFAIVAVVFVLCCPPLPSSAHASVVAMTPAHSARADGRSFGIQDSFSVADTHAAKTPGAAPGPRGAARELPEPGLPPEGMNWSAFSAPPAPGGRMRLLAAVLVLGAIARRRLRVH